MMLPKDTKRRKLDAAAADNSQSRLDAHLCEQKPKEHIIPYSDGLFQEAAIEWLIETDQVSSLLVPNPGLILNSDYSLSMQ